MLFFLFQDKETGNKYLDIGKMLFKIETEKSRKENKKHFPEKDWPEPKKRMAGWNGTVLPKPPKSLESLEFRVCPYCRTKIKASELACHIYCNHDFVCPKCPTVTKLKAGTLKKHWKSKGTEAKINKIKCSSCKTCFDSHVYCVHEFVCPKCPTIKGKFTEFVQCWPQECKFTGYRGCTTIIWTGQKSHY